MSRSRILWRIPEGMSTRCNDDSSGHEESVQGDNDVACGGQDVPQGETPRRPGDNDVRPVAEGKLRELIVEVVAASMDEVGGSSLTGHFKLPVVHVDRYRGRSTERGARDGSEAMPPQPKTATVSVERTRPRAAAWAPTVNGSTRASSFRDRSAV